MTTSDIEARLDNLLATAQAETADIDLFAPIIIKEREECPICMIPLPIDDIAMAFFECCGKRLCMGCVYKSKITDSRKNKNEVPKHEEKCAFCRKPIVTAFKHRMKLLKKRIKNDDANACTVLAALHETGQAVLQSNTKSLEMYIRAAELGHVDAFAKLGYYYQDGIGVELDLSKAIEFYGVGAKKGSVNAHNQLAMFHGKNGDDCKSLKHLKVAASTGNQLSMDTLMMYYKAKAFSKEDLAQTLRSFQSSRNEMKSKDRDDARVARANGFF